MVKLKRITDESWLVLAPDMSRIGVLSEQTNKKLVLLAKGIRETFNDRGEVENFFEDPSIFEDQLVLEYDTDSVFVRGMPVKGNKAFEVASEKLPENHNDLPIYTKKENSNGFLCAGYYAVDFCSYGWSPFFCPRFETISKYEYFGPFKTEEELKEAIIKLKSGISL